MTLSILGLIHTAISIVALLIGVGIIARSGRIEWLSSWGKTYFSLTILSCLTAFGIFRTGAFSPGHIIAILTIITLVVAVLASRIQHSLGKKLEVSLFSTSVLLSFIPAVVETFTRVPVGSPLAKGPEDPIVAVTIGAFSVLFFGIIVLQILSLKKVS